MNIQGEMMNDAFDMVGDADTDQQADEVYGQICAEIGIQQNQEMQTNTNAIAQPQSAQAIENVSK